MQGMKIQKRPQLIIYIRAMKVNDNRAISVESLFRKELGLLYTKEEIDTFLFYALNEYAGFSRADLVLKKENRFSESELLKFFRVIRKLKQHMPIQYILGNTEFFGLRLKVNEHVLIPRPETEELVEWVLEEYKSQSTMLNILDIGTGSGCIAIALKKKMQKAEVYALDISEKALALAKENAKENKADIHFIHANILEPEAFRHSIIPTFQVIISNPPYITESEKEMMHKNVLDHEPHLALFVPENDPLLFYRRILSFAERNLSPGGTIFFELNALCAKRRKQTELTFPAIKIKVFLGSKNRAKKDEQRRGTGKNRTAFTAD